MASAESPLVALPDPCLLRVLKCCAADNNRSILSAARAHSRLHQVAVVALSSITAQFSKQHQLGGVMVYIRKHGQHVNSLDVTGLPRADDPNSVQIRQLPQQVQLTSLQFNHLRLQLLPGSNRSQGVLGNPAAIAALKQLRLNCCRVVDSGAAAALTAALSQLPAGLEHVALTSWRAHQTSFPVEALQQLQHLTCLELDSVQIAGPDEATPALQALTRLVGLRLANMISCRVTCSMLSNMHHLTRLELIGDMVVEPGCLAGKTKLQHLTTGACNIRGGAAGVAQLLSHLQPLQHLTRLSLYGSLQSDDDSNPPASAYAALTASSKLQALSVHRCTLPTGVWQHMFPTGRKLPDLRSLGIEGVRQPAGGYAQAPASTSLLSCCPGLQSLYMLNLVNPELSLLQGLGALQNLHVSWHGSAEQAVQAVCHLAGLRSLNMSGLGRLEEASLLDLTQLTQLTSLQVLFHHQDDEVPQAIDLNGGDEPVWRQLARLHLDHPGCGVAQQAAAALADVH